MREGGPDEFEDENDDKLDMIEEESHNSIEDLHAKNE